jgi:hypothetical protein
MRSSLTDIRTIEAYLTDAMKPGERLVFEAKMFLNRELRKNVRMQKTIMSLAARHYRARLKLAFEAHLLELWNDPVHTGLKNEITHLFKNT